jgi:hypothetical protein
MRLSNSIFIFGLGIAIGISLVLSCGDDSPRRVDAADAPMCDCPAAEPPIAARIMETKLDDVIPANATHRIRGVTCPGVPPAMALNGGCTADIPVNGSIVLEQSAPGEGIGWLCSWSNPSNVDVPVHAIVRCLKPAQ